MATGSNTSNQPLVLQARKALDQFKYEVANELGLQGQGVQEFMQNGYGGYLTSRDAGAIGGHMVRRMIQAAEQALIDQAASGVRAGFQNAQVSNPTAPVSGMSAQRDQYTP